MKNIRRILFISVLIILIGAALIVLNVITPDTESPLEQLAPIVAAIAGAVLTMLSAWAGYDTVKSWELPEPEDPPSSVDKVVKPKDPVSKVEVTVDAVRQAEEYIKQATGRVEIDIDIDDEWDDED